MCALYSLSIRNQAKSFKCWVRILYLLLIASAGLEHARAEQSDDSVFFQQRAQNSYNAIFGLPAVAARSVQSFESQISLEHSNQFAGGQHGGESLSLDGETSELVIRHRQRLASCWQFAGHLPLIYHGGGQFDGAINRWHDLFGFPDADRELVAPNRIYYRYSRSVDDMPSVTAAQSGIGDIQLSIQRALRCFATGDSTMAEPIVRLGVKLPTGNGSELRGSGATDFYVDIQSPIWSLGSRMRYGATVGILRIGDSEQFNHLRSSALYGSIGTQFIYSHRLRLITQLDWHTPFYDSALRELGDNAVGIAIGGRYLLPGNQSLEISLSEDLAVDTTPDVMLRLAWTNRP